MEDGDGEGIFGGEVAGAGVLGLWAVCLGMEEMQMQSEFRVRVRYRVIMIQMKHNWW